MTKEQEINFTLKHARLYSDIIISRLFEKLPLKINLRTFNDELINDIKSVDMIAQMSKFTYDGKAAWAT